MNKKKYKAKERLIIVLEGIKGNVSLGELCNQYGISQQTYYNWRDRLLSEGSKIFSYGGVDREKEVLKQEVSRLKETVGELTMELKKKRLVRSRKRSDKVKIRDVFLLKKIDLIKSEHPYWGYRRVWAYMKYMNKESFAMARIYRIIKENNLLCTKNNRLRAKRTPPYPSKPKATKRNEVWGTDMTKIKTSLGWLHIHIVLDWYTKKIVGYYMSDKSKTEDWLQSLHMAINRQFPNGYRTKIRPLQLVSDNGCQPTSSAFMKACSQMGIKQLFTSFNNPKGNAETERVIRTLKEEISWPNAWDNGFSASSEVIRAIKKYNEDYPHSVINYFTPNAFDNLCKQMDLYSRSCA